MADCWKELSFLYSQYNTIVVSIVIGVLIM